MTAKPPLSQYAEVVDEKRRWTADWYSWLLEFTSLASAGVSSFNTRTGAVTLNGTDITGAGGALIASPTFTGDPKGPTPVIPDNDTSLATTAFVWSAMSAFSYINVAAPPYNAVGDGTTDNTTAFNNALAALGARGGTLYFPAGKYRFNSLITKSYTLNATYDLTIVGDGQDSTILFWPSGVSGLRVNFNSNTATTTQSLHIRDLSITTADTPGSGRIGLNIQQSGTLVGAYVSNSELTRVVFRGDDGVVSTNGWSTAVNIFDVSNVILEGCSLHGTSTPNGNGVVWAGSSGHIPTGLYFANCVLNSFSSGIRMDDFVQGLYLTACQINGCTVGLNLIGGASSSDAAVALSDCEFGVYNTNASAISVTNAVSQLQIDNTNFNTTSTIVGPISYIALAAMSHVQITNNVFISAIWPGSGSVGTKVTGISLAGTVSATGAIITGNIFAGFFGTTSPNNSTAIVIQASADRVLISGNTFIGNQSVPGTTSCINNSGTNVIVSNNQYDSGFGPAVNTYVGDALKIKSDKTGENYGSPVGAFGINMGNLHGSAGDHGVATFSGSTGTADTSTVCLYFLDPSSNVCGSVTRVDSGGTRRVAFNGIVQLNAVSFANLPTGVVGRMACITDSTQPPTAGGQVIAGGGGSVVIGFFDGLNWRVT